MLPIVIVSLTYCYHQITLYWAPRGSPHNRSNNNDNDNDNDKDNDEDNDSDSDNDNNQQPSTNNQ